MKKYELEVTVDVWRDFSKIYEVYESQKDSAFYKLELFLSPLHPMDVLIITQFAIWCSTKGGGVELEAIDDSYDYLKEVGIEEFTNSNIHSPSTLEEISSRSAMPIKRVDRDTMYSYILATEEYLKSRCPSKDLQMLQVCLSELINNVYDHSHSPIDAYVFCEYYEESNMIVIAVSDLGIGIPKSVKDYRKKELLAELSSEECVKWALVENSTTKSLPRNLGKGLDTLNSFVQTNQSTWKMLTGDVLMKAFPNATEYYENPIEGFIGTIVELEIRVDNLSEAEVGNENEMDW